jgi:hypothetical protein
VLISPSPPLIFTPLLKKSIPYADALLLALLLLAVGFAVSLGLQKFGVLAALSIAPLFVPSFIVQLPVVSYLLTKKYVGLNPRYIKFPSTLPLPS